MVSGQVNAAQEAVHIKLLHSLHRGKAPPKSCLIFLTCAEPSYRPTLLGRNMHQLTGLHHSSTRAVLRQHAEGWWRINLDLSEGNQPPLRMVGLLSPTREKAKELADREILRHGHVCTVECRDWESKKAGAPGAGAT